MALKKTITQENGVTTEYHRIALVSIDVNQQTTILVCSYIDENGRNLEKEYANGGNSEPTFPYIENNYYSFGYDEKMNIENAYNWLKQQADFENSVDC